MLFEGYQLKKLHLVDHSFPSNHSDCPGELKSKFSQVKSDQLIPSQKDYEHHDFIDLYKVFCKKKMKNMQQVYTQGVELQQKMQQINSFNQCNDDKAIEQGRTQYCVNLFADQNMFVFWNKHDIEEECKAAGEMSCAQLNENIFKKHNELQKKAIDRVVSFVENEIQKKHDKEAKLKQFVMQADDLDMSEVPSATANI